MRKSHEKIITRENYRSNVFLVVYVCVYYYYYYYYYYLESGIDFTNINQPPKLKYDR